MKNRPSPERRGARQLPLDHLRRGEQNPSEDRDEASPPPPSPDLDAARGKNTRTTASVATREHLEGSEQGPA